MAQIKVRWGILGAANIARKNWKAICNAGNSTVVAVASRDLKRCRAFIGECQAEAPMEQPPKAFGSYEELLTAKDVDAVVIGTPDHWHAPATILACDAGKHVYVEKPCSHNLREGRLMLEAAEGQPMTVLPGIAKAMDDAIAKGHGKDDLGAIAAEVVR